MTRLQMNSQLAAAYGVCRQITRSAARNFYYGFLVLPRERRDALSAVYAFMRHSDDLSDEPGLTRREREDKLAEWRDALHRVAEGEHTDDPVLLAVADAQRRFKIPLELFDRLVDGTAMDVTSQPGEPIRYQTFDDLRRYCYHVASVVGLICIKIFGYRDAAAEALAEQCGLAFQLTNIIRDVKEDAAMGRVYLPEEDLERFGRSAAELDPACLKNGFDDAGFRPVLEFEAERARELYRAAEQLLPLIDEDSRPALWVLVEIYRRLLEKIAARGYNVFGKKIRLSRREKLSVLARGFWRRLA
ncbi:MAG: phytoene/squalene synthase family protein [Terriglobales bacterium]